MTTIAVHTDSTIKAVSRCIGRVPEYVLCGCEMHWPAAEPQCEGCWALALTPSEVSKVAERQAFLRSCYAQACWEAEQGHAMDPGTIDEYVTCMM